MKLLLLLGMVTTVLCMPGGKTTQLNPESDMRLVDALSFAMEKLNGLLTSDPKMVKVNIIKAETQVVSGMNYFLTIKVHYGTEEKECQVTIYSKPWMNYKELSSQNCIDTSASNDMVLGGVVPINADQEAKTAISFGIEEFNARSNNLYRTLPLQITNLTKQLVSGNLYKFDAMLQTSTCQNNPDNKNKGLDKCPASSTNNVQSKCSFEVLHQSWLSTPWSLSNFHCEQDRALKVSLLGGDGHDLCHLTHFQNFKSSFKKSYKTTEEEVKRFKIFCDNMKKARKMQDIEKGSAKYGPTIFADMTVEEFSQRLNHKPWNVDIRPDNMLDADIPEGNVPTSFDWRDHGAVTPVKNQGSCGSCWAFSTTGNIEGQWAIKMKKLISLSEQELVDCDKVDQGCNGGLPSQAYEAIIKLGGLETEKEYGYKGFDEKCFFNKSEAVVKISGSVKISSNEANMAAWLAENGPISIGINAFAMQFYMGGIAHPWKIFCNPKKLDHGVLIVGYGIKNNEPYWIVKNSWGPRWGEQGYYLVYRGDGVCGLNTMCTSATVN